MNRESYIIESQVNYYYYFCGLTGQLPPPRCWPAGYAGRANAGQWIENVNPPRVFYRGPPHFATPTWRSGGSRGGRCNRTWSNRSLDPKPVREQNGICNLEYPLKKETA